MSGQAVRHELENNRFVINTPSGEALLEYRRVGGYLDFYHTFVPPTERGHGYAEAVVQAGFEYARAQGLRVMATCKYVSWAFLRLHPEYRALTISDALGE